MNRRVSIFGPVVILALGVLFLAQNFRPELRVWNLFATYWPLLLILWGVLLLVDVVHPQTPRRPLFSAGEIFLIVFLCMFGLSMAEVPGRFIRFGPPVYEIFGDQYTFEQEARQAVAESAPRIRVENVRGPVNVEGAEAAEIAVKAEKQVRALDENDAKEIERQAGVAIVREGSGYVVRGQRPGYIPRGSVDLALTIRVPKGAQVQIRSERGSVSVRDVAGPLKIDAERADVSLAAIGGATQVDLRRGNFSADRIQGDLVLDGRANEVRIADVTGEVALRGEFYGSLSFSNVAKGVRFNGVRTEFEVEQLPGRIELGGGALLVRQPAGGVKVTTRGRQVEIEDFEGRVEVSNREGSVSLSARKPPTQPIVVDNARGRIDLSLPSDSKFHLDASTRRGQAESDFQELAVRRERRNSTITGQVGQGGAEIKLHTGSGNVSVRKAG
jgi:hypothetical protein